MAWVRLEDCIRNNNLDHMMDQVVSFEEGPDYYLLRPEIKARFEENLKGKNLTLKQACKTELSSPEWQYDEATGVLSSFQMWQIEREFRAAYIYQITLPKLGGQNEF